MDTQTHPRSSAVEGKLETPSERVPCHSCEHNSLPPPTALLSSPRSVSKVPMPMSAGPRAKSPKPPSSQDIINQTCDKQPASSSHLDQLDEVFDSLRAQLANFKRTRGNVKEEEEEEDFTKGRDVKTSTTTYTLRIIPFHELWPSMQSHRQENEKSS
ncbi:hypothetical protein AC578_5905 [Pseudocercospora eumusae]|uniref:Uncharacterized protein n=1 Tax=Pseudocercospora eumusae TaxID=321146 RepID=A0A139HBF7_9PEZI|nr:hypothetical protein AC578_5905 [Pseudocercospora eumusae]